MASRRRTLLQEADITPHRSLLPKMGASGYSLPEAVAELVDNSIEWRVPGAPVTVAIYATDERVVVADDARGMTAPRLASAMKLAYRDATSEQHTTLSQFGIGMKTATSSLGRRFRVATTVAGATSRYEVEFDQDKWERGSGFDWRLPVYEVADAEPVGSHGTTITITRLNLKPRSRLSDLRRDFAQRYATFLESGDARLLVNGVPLEPERPQVDAGTRRDVSLEFEGGRVHGWFGLLSEGSQKGYYGWETKRRGRTITMHDKRFGLREHPEFMKVAGVIHLDFLAVSHNKTRWIEDARFQRLQDFLDHELRPAVRELVGAEKRARLEARTRVAVDRWVRAMATAAADEAEPARAAPPAPRTIQRLKKEFPAPSLKRGEPAPPPHARDASPPAERLPRVRVRRSELRVEHRFHPMGDEGPWFEWGVRDDGVVEVFTNEEFPAFHVAEDKAFYAALHVAEAIAKLTAREGAEDEAGVRERVLRKAATEFLREAEVAA